MQTAYFPNLRILLKNNFSYKINSPEEINYLLISDGKSSDTDKERVLLSSSTLNTDIVFVVSIPESWLQ